MKSEERCKLVVVNNRIDMRIRGRGMKEHLGKEVGCPDRQWMGGRAFHCFIANGKKLYL